MPSRTFSHASACSPGDHVNVYVPTMYERLQGWFRALEREGAHAPEGTGQQGIRHAGLQVRG